MKPMNKVANRIPNVEELREVAKTFENVRPDAILALKRFLFVATEMERVLEAHFGRYGLSRARFSMLMCLYYLDEKGALTSSALAERLQVTRGNMTGLIDGLLEVGYILKEDDSLDRRAVKIKLSKAGRKFLDKILPDHFCRTSKAFEVMTKKDIQSFESCLDKLQTGMDLIEADLRK